MPIPVKHCLFCYRKKPFATVKLALRHMLRHHGFFIPFVEHCTDLEGLLQYLGFKIGVGHECIQCTKGKSTFGTTSVRPHLA